MINRIQHLVDHPLEPARQDDYYEIEGYCNTYTVTLRTALAVERQLEDVPSPRWIEFRDLFGARQRVIAGHVYRITESTSATRAAIRAFSRERSEEEEADPDRPL